MNRYFFVLLIILSGFIKLSGQSDEFNIPFVETMPLIDGFPDNLQGISDWHSFPGIGKTNDKNSDYGVNYKTAYNFNFFYLLIEATSDSIIVRDRAYQNGDGFHLVIAKPVIGQQANEFYVLQFSPSDKSKNLAARKAIWYYNIDLSGRPLSSATKLECSSIGGKSYFELLLPWNDVYPYNPLFNDSIGINFCFVKAVGEKEKNYYFVKYDERIQSELSKRDYVIAKFDKPDELDNSCSFARLEQKNIMAGQSLKIRTISYVNSQNTASYYFAISSADNFVYGSLFKRLNFVKGFNSNEFEFPTEKINPRGYKLVWKCSDGTEGEIPFTILPYINEENEKAALNSLKSQISEGDYHTLLFRLNSILNSYSQVKTYETAGNIREAYLNYIEAIAGLKKDNHSLTDKKGISRRAFLSEIDNTLQPYTIKIPGNFSRDKKYPLFVMLHGSGSDDQYMLGNNLTNNQFIEIAPFGRGTSNCFTTDNAEKDVKEAIDDVIRNYPVDTTKIILAGFSMGGYGAYRIFYEYPKLFKGVAVFSGHPNLASKWIGEGYPDFLDAKYLKSFKNLPVFIYHSKNDLNCPYSLTEQLVKKLIKAGAKVEFVTTGEGGHGIIDESHIENYFKWIQNTLNK